MHVQTIYKPRHTSTNENRNDNIRTNEIPARYLSDIEPAEFSASSCNKLPRGFAPR